MQIVPGRNEIKWWEKPHVVTKFVRDDYSITTAC